MADSQNNVTQDPWAATQAATDSTTSADPWGSTTDTATQATDAAQSWLHTATPETQFDWLNPFDETLIPFGDWVESAINWLVANFRGFFQAVSAPVDYVLSLFQTLLTTLPTPFMILALVLIAWQLTNTKMALTTLVSLLAIGAIGAWDQMLITLALVLTSVSFCLIIGLPLGIWLARSKRATKFVTPLLDAMQTTPAFVYLVPIVMLFGIGNVPGVVVTIIFALPPVVRLTILGIKQVPESLVEAGNAFGATPNQLLFKVQLPLAKPSIMAGINQTLMLSLSMVVIASMIAVGGLGQMVLRGIGRLDMGLAATGGVGIVIMAIVLDRLTQALGLSSREGGKKPWLQRGPIGLVMKLLGKK